MTTDDDTEARLRSLYEQEGGAGAIFSTKVADYSVSRPDYPPPLFETLRTICKLSADAVIVDLGAGTGLLTQGFLKRDYCVVAVEPNAAMRKACDDSLRIYPKYRSVEGSAESIPLEGLSADLITAAQAFHWFKIEEARSECFRVLKPLGNVALIWNDRVSADPLHVALDPVFAEFGGERRAALASHEKRASVLRFFGTTVPTELSWPHEHRLDEKGLVSLVLSRSYMPQRGSSAGEEVRSRVREVFSRFAEAGMVTVRYTTVAATGRPAE
jgi:SAM-dependent methyltransferase